MKNELKGHVTAFAIFTETLCEGLVPVWRDGNGHVALFATEREAQVFIAESAIEALQEFIAGEREFNDATFVQDVVLPVDMSPDGTIVIEDGRSFPIRV